MKANEAIPEVSAMQEQVSEGRLDSRFVAESYREMRDWLVETWEKEQREPPDRWEEWLARQPRLRNQALADHLERLGLGREERQRLYQERDRLLEVEGEAYREYFQTLERDTQEGRDKVPPGDPPRRVDLQLLAPDAEFATPYAVLGLASDPQMLAEDFLPDEIRNPYAEKLNENVYRPLLMDLWGKGSGIYDASFLPEFPTSKWADVAWIMYFDLPATRHCP